MFPGESHDLTYIFGKPGKLSIRRNTFKKVLKALVLLVVFVITLLYSFILATIDWRLPKIINDDLFQVQIFLKYYTYTLREVNLIIVYFMFSCIGLFMWELYFNCLCLLCLLMFDIFSCYFFSVWLMFNSILSLLNLLDFSFSLGGVNLFMYVLCFYMTSLVSAILCRIIKCQYCEYHIFNRVYWWFTPFLSMNSVKSLDGVKFITQ